MDFYVRAAVQAWRCMESATSSTAVDPVYQAGWQTYQESLLRLMDAANRYGRLDPRGQLIISGRCGPQQVPIVYYGFAWRPSDFCQLVLAEEFRTRDLVSYYRAPGLGISLVAVRHDSAAPSFFRERQPFPVTAVLRPARFTEQLPYGGLATSPPEDYPAVLEFYNPCLFDSLSLGAAFVPIKRDLSAPFAYAAEDSSRQYLEGFFDPSELDVQPKLFMMEPYQRGKIPVVFIHGLLSDPATWLDAVNELRAHRDLYQQYQFWYFRYPTGGALLESAARLREQLLVAREILDPVYEDEAMERTILVGHSMGGLVAKLQVTYSYDILWRHAARQPLEAVRTTPDMRQRLERDFFFDPLPLVTRVVYVGTPHRGSNLAQRFLARVASRLVRPFGTEEPRYRQLMDDNQDIFFEHLRQSPPTSIDLLEPENPLLEALVRMPVSRCVRLHSIIGTGGTILGGEPGDGVVPVSSARQAGVSSEFLVPVRHQELHHDAATLAELVRILRQHAGETTLPTRSARAAKEGPRPCS